MTTSLTLASRFVSVASLSHTEALLLAPAPLRRPWRSPLIPRRLMLGLAASGLCHLAAIVLLGWLPAAVLTTDAKLPGQQSVLTVAFVDVPSVADPEPATVEVLPEPDPSSSAILKHPVPIEPCPAPVNRTDTPPPAIEPVMAMLEPPTPSDTVTPTRDTPQRAALKQPHAQPRIAVEPIAAMPRRRLERPTAFIAVAVPATIGSAETTIARPRDNPLPEYPIEALRRALHGRVTLRVTVSPEGTVSGLVVARSSGYRSFDEAALEAVKDWQFEPARRFGQPIASTVLLPIRFLPR